MIKLLIIPFLMATVYARENPFFPSNGENDITYSSNIIIPIKPLEKAVISLPPKARTVESVTIKYKNLDGSIDTKTLKLGNTIDWHLPIFISQKEIKNDESFQKIASVKYAKFLTSGKKLKIMTKDTLIRNFLLVKPHRIVLDFKKEKFMKAYMKKNANNIFQKIRVASHDGYYRVVIELDGYYKYSFKTIPNGLVFQLK